jgi:hypothetical protein
MTTRSRAHARVGPVSKKLREEIAEHSLHVSLDL